MSRLSRSSSGAGYQPHPSTNPGATSVWVGSPPATQNTQQLSSQMAALRFSSDRDSNPRHNGQAKRQNSLGPSSSDDVNDTSKGQYFVVSVRDSASSGDGGSGYNGSAVYSPRSPNEIVSPADKSNSRNNASYSTRTPSQRLSTSGRDDNNSSTVYSPQLSTQSVSPFTTGNVQMNHYAPLPSLNPTGSMEAQSHTQFHPSYLQPGTGVGGVYSNTGSNVYGSSGLLPAAGGVSYDPGSNLPQAIYDPNALASHFRTQPFMSTDTISPELLAASFGQPGLNDSQALLSSLTYLNQLNQLNQPVDVNALAAAMVANQSTMSSLQSPTSPLFMSPTLTSVPFSSATFTSMPFSSATFTSPLPPMPLSTPTWTSLPLSPTSLTSPLPLTSPMFTGVSSPLAQSSLYLNSQPGLANGHQNFFPHFTPGSNDGAATTGQVVTRKRSNLSNTGSFDDQATSGLGSSLPSTPSDSSPTSPRYEHGDHHPLADHEESNNAQFAGVPPCYDPPADKNACMRCGKKVYAMEKLGPVKDALYHKMCFTCAVCHTKLTLQNFQHSDADMADLHVYCQSHKPCARANPVDACAVGIQRALSVPKLGKINDQIRGGPEASKHALDTHSVSIRAAMTAPAPTLQTSIKTREGHTAWFRQHRQSERMPPQDVVKHDGEDQHYEGSRSLYINTSD